jgi:hypothetical protein
MFIIRFYTENWSNWVKLSFAYIINILRKKGDLPIEGFFKSIGKTFKEVWKNTILWEGGEISDQMP